MSWELLKSKTVVCSSQFIDYEPKTNNQKTKEVIKNGKAINV